MAVEITVAHWQATTLARTASIPRIRALCDQFERLCQTIENAGPSDASMGHWADAQYATQRAAIYNALHTAGAALIVDATAVHDAAAGIVTDWT